MERADLPLKRAVFFDRDGVLNRDMHYPRGPEDLIWMPGAIEAVRLCNERGLLTFVVSNQSGVARGYFPESAILAFHRKMAEDLAVAQAWIDEFQYCPHLTDAVLGVYRRDCACRKPKPGMILHLIEKWGVDSQRSILVGDKDSDIIAAERAGIVGYKFLGGSLRDFIRERIGSARAPDERHDHRG